MGKRIIVWLGILCAVFIPACLFAQSASSVVKISVFTFGTVNSDSSGYGTTVTNMLTTSLAADSSLAMLDRKELESFLNLHDLQQNEDTDNVVQIGSRLSLDVIVVGSVEKKGPIINIRCNLIQVDRKRSMFRTRVAAVGDAGLTSEVRKLSEQIRQAIAEQLAKQRGDERAAVISPANIQKRAGNQRVILSWEPPGTNIAGYEVYRASSEKGPFAKVDQVTRTEFIDEGIERNTTYYYKIRAFDPRGLRSPFSAPVAAETALTPSPPVILSTESHIKSISLAWSPGAASEDPLKLKGYKLFRAKVEGGPYKEIANILGTDLGLGLDGALDKLLKVPYLDKGLADGEDYYYKATAYNEKGLESDFSRPVRGTVVPAVSGLSARGEMVREIELVWNHMDYSCIRGYYVYRSTSPDANFLKIKKVAPDPGTEKSIRYRDTEGLTDKTRYHYRVTALEENDLETSASVTVSAVTKGKPPMPLDLQAKGGLVKKVDLAWTAGKQDDIEGYSVYASKEKQGPFQLLKKLSGREVNRYTDDTRNSAKLEDGTQYYFRITSFNKVDVESEPTSVISAVTKPRPGKPAGLKSEGVKVKSASLRWTANPEKDLAAYHIFRSAEAKGESFSSVGKAAEKTDYTDRDLADGQTYLYRIQAEDRDGLLSDFSGTITVQVKAKPQAPQGLNGAPKGGGAVIQWKSNAEPDIASYNVYEKGFFKPAKIGQVGKDTSYTDDRPLKAGKERVYLITAVDKDDLESEFSQELTVVGQ